VSDEIERSERQADEHYHRQLVSRDNTIAELGASNARLIEERDQLRAELDQLHANAEMVAHLKAATIVKERDELRERMYGLEQWRRLVSDLDRCPHGRHEGDTCAGWRGPGLYDGGCRDGISLGNPLLGGMAVLGVGLDGAQLIRVPEEKADRVNAERWYAPAEPGEMLHHHLAGYVGQEEAAKVGLTPDSREAPTNTHTWEQERDEWGHSPGERCESTHNTGEEIVRCYRMKGHTKQHASGIFTYSPRWSDTVDEDADYILPSMGTVVGEWVSVPAAQHEAERKALDALRQWRKDFAVWRIDAPMGDLIAAVDGLDAATGEATPNPPGNEDDGGVGVKP
jgi:hypothetical protein